MFTVDPITGKPTIDFLDNWDKWRPAYNLVYILTAVQVRPGAHKDIFGLKIHFLKTIYIM